MPKLKKRKDQKDHKAELPKDKKTELLILKLQNNSLNKDFSLVLAQDQVNLEELMDTFWKEKNLNSTQRKLKPERNDLMYIKSIFNIAHLSFIYYLYIKSNSLFINVIRGLFIF